MAAHQRLTYTHLVHAIPVAVADVQAHAVLVHLRPVTTSQSPDRRQSSDAAAGHGTGSVPARMRACDTPR
jgi:hypothetical protein